MLVAGFGVPASSLRRLQLALERDGRVVTVAPTGLNLDCGEATASRLATFVATLDAPVALVGHSRGGQLARVVAVRHPDLVERLVTVGTPWTIGPPDRFAVAQMTALVRGARRMGLPLLASIDCADGSCCTTFREDLRSTPSVPWTALWSSTDRVAGADSRPPPEADVAVDVDASHLGLVRSQTGIDAIRAVLDGV